MLAENDERVSNAEPVQRFDSDRRELAADFWSGHVCPWSEQRNLPALGPDRRSLNMDLLVTIVQIVKDLLGSVNPFRLFKRDHRASFQEIWRQEPLVFRIGYVLGAVGLLLLIALAFFWFLRGIQV